jgi:hypothetical protein
MKPDFGAGALDRRDGRRAQPLGHPRSNLITDARPLAPCHSLTLAHQPRPARDAAHALERGGVESGQC